MLMPTAVPSSGVPDEAHPMTTRGRGKESADRKFLGDVGKFLERQKWRAIIVGGWRITSRPDLFARSPEFRYTLEIDFLGGPIREPKKKPTRRPR